MRVEFFDRFDSMGKRYFPAVFLGGVLLAAFIGVSDYLSGAELAFSIFYLVPISLVTLFARKAFPGLAMSLCSAAMWLAADYYGGARYSHWLIPYWNTLVRLGYFCLHSVLLSYLLRLFHTAREQSLRDPLTNAANWRYFEEYAQREIARERRVKQPVTLAYFDLDNFKKVNDTLGHDAGDELLRSLADSIQGRLRPSDMLCRVGGDEFAILLPATDYQGAAAVLARIRETALAVLAGGGWPVTLSMGAITFTVLPSSVGPMIKRADELMYTVKHGGKNDLKHLVWPPEGGESVSP